MSRYKVDTTHSEIAFAVKHMMFAKVRGSFKIWSADLSYDSSDPTKSSVKIDVDVASVDTHESSRDESIRSGDFFNASVYPKMTFVSQRIDSVGNGCYKVAGDLTIRNATHPVTFDVKATGGGADPQGNRRLGFHLNGSIHRSDWGLKWSPALEAGGVLVSEKVDIEAEFQLVEVADVADVPT